MIIYKTDNGYQTHNGKTVDDPIILDWITSLRIPPAWTDVKIFYQKNKTCCGYDAKGRKQCLYSETHRERARANKYCDLIAFGERILEIQADMRRALQSTKMTKNKIISLVLHIVVHCSFRLGTLKYEEQNESYGITTIRDSHLRFHQNKIDISFIGKKGVLNECQIDDPEIVNILKKITSTDRGDTHVMMYQEGGEWYHLTHLDVNKFLNEYGKTFTSKDFRTFQSNMSIIELLPDPQPLAKNIRKRTMNEAIKKVAHEIHNTPAVCRKDYIDPELLQCYMEHPVKYRKMFVTPDTSSRVKFLNWLKLKC